MKELSIEEKARRYDEAKYIMKEYLESSNAGVIAENTIKNTFPELSESEDEKIRKEIIEVFKRLVEGTIPANLNYADIFTWLEKQAQKPVDKIQLGKKYKCIASPRYSTFMIGKIYKPEDKFLCSLMNFCSDCFEPIEDGEQKHADKVESAAQNKPWSEEDEKIYQSIMDDTVQENQLNDKQTNWLRDIKYRFQQPKQKILKKLEEWLDEYVSDLADVDTASLICSFTNYLDGKLPKSLRPRSQWKPRKEQMEAIKDAIEFLGCTKKVREDLKSLYEQLKKLMEE